MDESDDRTFFKPQAARLDRVAYDIHEEMLDSQMPMTWDEARSAAGKVIEIIDAYAQRRGL